MAQKFFAIGRDRYRTQVVHGRLYLNGTEHAALADEETQIIRVSDTLPIETAVSAVASLVSELWIRRKQPPVSKSAIASDGAKYHGPVQEAPPQEDDSSPLA